MINHIKPLIDRLREIQEIFSTKHGVGDIYTNSKVYEILIADKLNHRLIPGHSGSRDGKDKNGEYEYKHYKETSSNHTWTFNDFSDTTIDKLNHCYGVIFAHIDDAEPHADFDWYYSVPGKIMSNYLLGATKKIKNARKMINVSSSQIENTLKIKRSLAKAITSKKYYSALLKEIFIIAQKLEEIVGTKGVLTSNKLWEVLVATHTGHKILSKQSKHDAIDELGNFYEYKVPSKHGWSFQDISDAVLEKFTETEAVILAVVDKSRLEVKDIYSADSEKVLKRLREKLEEKRKRYEARGKSVRRTQVSLGKADLKLIEAKSIFSAD